MFGVVLWSDLDERKAVIWCEDHGDLAFYNQQDTSERVPLDPGDWVQFDLTMERNMRFAQNPRLVAEGVYDGLAEVLDQTNTPVASEPQKRQTRGSAEIIAFNVAHKRRGDEGLGSTIAGFA